MTTLTTADLKQKCIAAEHYETPEWAARAILEKEILTKHVVDPCCGTGILSEAAIASGSIVASYDIHDWGYKPTTVLDWLSDEHGYVGMPLATLFMNPPFSFATQFVEKAIERKFRKIIVFQRFNWFESQTRRGFWDKHPPNRVYVCGDLAACWRHDLAPEERKSSTPTAHAWFVWDRDAPAGTILGRIYK